jgi:hypothetical protein
MSDQQSHLQMGRGQKGGPWTYGHLWATNPGYWGPQEIWRMPYYGPYGPMWGAPPMAPPPQVQYVYQGNQACSASQGQPKAPTPSKKSAQPYSKKRKVAEVASGSQPKAGSAKAVSLPLKVGKLSPQEQAVQLRAAKRTESFARLTRKAHLYQSAMDRFCRSLVYHNRRFGESIQEG